MHVTGQKGALQRLTENLHRRLTLGEESLAAMGSWPCISSTSDLTLNRQSYIPNLCSFNTNANFIPRQKRHWAAWLEFNARCFNFFPTHRTLWDDRKFSLPAASATGGWQALRHSWMHRTLMCGTNAKNSTAGLLIVKWIQLLLVFSWGFQPPQSDKPWFSILDSDPISVRTKALSEEFPALSILGFPQYC